MPKIVEQIGIGAALVGASLFIPGGFLAAGSLLSGASGVASLLATAGAGLVLSGVGTLLSQKATGISTTSRNPISPWQIVYGNCKVGGTIVYQEEVASSNRILLLVVAIAAHPIDAVTQVWLNGKPIILQLNPQFADESNPNGFWQSITPTQGNWQIETISRTNDVVSVTFTQNPNSILSGFSGQTFRIENTRDSAGDNSFDGYFPVVQTGPNGFSYTSGGPQGAGTGNPGTVVSTWPDYKGTVTVGYYLGNQTAASGIILGNTVGGPVNGQWTPDHILKGRSYVAMKLVYDSTVYNGMPEISFVVHGKNDIYDPRTGKTGYTNNAALCIADYLAQPIWGFNAFNLDSTEPAPAWSAANWGTQIPTAQLIAAANICDEQVTLALGGSENRYCCDGAFDVSVKRADVLQNLLTSCGGRLVYIGGQFLIFPAAWVTPTGAVTIGGCSGAPKMMMNNYGLVAEAFNSPTNSYVPGCAGSSQSQFVYALGLLQAYQAVGNSNALGLAKLVLSAIVPYLFRGMAIPDQVTAQNIWSFDSYFSVKQAFLDANGATIQINQDFATTLAGTWRSLVGGEIQSSCDGFNWAMRLFLLAAQVLDGETTAPTPDLGYGLSPYGSSYGDPEQPNRTINSGWLQMLSAIQQMARIAYHVQFVEISGSSETVINPMYQDGMIPMILSFLGTPNPTLNTWLGPAYIGYQSPWAVSQVNAAEGVANAVQLLAEAQASLASAQTVADTITITITGANPQVISLPIQINAIGAANAAFEYAGLSAGTDTIVATLPSHSLTSNTAKLAWTAYPVAMAVFGVSIDIMAADGSGLFNALGPVLSTTQCLGLMFNSHPQSIFPGDPHSSGNQANPFANNAVATDGSYAGDILIPNTSQAFNGVIKFSMSIETPGNYGFTVYVNSAFVIGFNGSVAYVSGTRNFGALSGGTAEMGYPALAGLNTAGDWPGGNWAVVTFTLHFPNPGIYQGEIDFASGLFGEREFCMLMDGLGSAISVIPNIEIPTGASGTTASGTAPSGQQLQITPYSGGYALGQSTTPFTLSLTGISTSSPSAGPFAPVYQYQVPAGAQTWGTVGAFGWFGPDPNYAAGYYQYRPLAELCDLIAQAAGTEGWYNQAVTVTSTFLTWLHGAWTTAASGPPNYFPQSGPQTTAVDVHCAALILYSVMSLDLAARPMGGGTGGMNPTYLALTNSVYTLLGDTYLTSGPMVGTFCLDASGAQDWSPIWSGELLRALSKLVEWAGLNGQAAMQAQAIIWINGLINFGLDSVEPVDPDLGYTVNDLSGAVTWMPKLARTDLYNGIKGTYISQANQWQQSDFPSYAQDTLHGYTNGPAQFDNDANWASDGQRRWKDVQLPFTTSVSAAQRLAKIELLRIRQQGRGSLQGMMSLYQVAPLDIVYMSFAPLAWINKVLEISNARLLKKQVEGGPALMTEIDIAESDASVYEWSATEELSVNGYSYLPGLSNLAPD